MLEILKQLLHIHIDTNQLIFTGKWLLVLPATFFNGWIYWRAIKSFAPKK